MSRYTSDIDTDTTMTDSEGASFKTSVAPAGSSFTTCDNPLSADTIVLTIDGYGSEFFGDVILLPLSGQAVANSVIVW